eukprot:TRINITY_DN14333_c0_g1_i1.p1 TRINITY_DN14333_c0_g1~~TRINITY_DN14333_c0_g1_i1.p1  ORF type:complete len:311 (+),score=98.17 TRINITY_DN14333_c0_g1_i1:146-1078(+)
MKRASENIDVEESSFIPENEEFATIHLVDLSKCNLLGKCEDEDEGYAEEEDIDLEDTSPCAITIEELERVYPGISLGFRRGDILEDTSASGYRSQGGYMIDVRRKKAVPSLKQICIKKFKKSEDNQIDNLPEDIKEEICGNEEGRFVGNIKFQNYENFEAEIIDLEYKFDDYGSPSRRFKAITEFPMNYWDVDDLNVNNIVEGESDFYWHSEESTIVCINGRELGLADLKLEDFINVGNDYYCYHIFTYNDKKYMIISYASSLKYYFEEKEKPFDRDSFPINEEDMKYYEDFQPIIEANNIEDSNILSFT